jgi:antitoxin HicB
MAEHGYNVIYEQLSVGGYQVIVPALPGIVTYGRTLEEAREMARDAIECHLRGLLEDGEEIPGREPDSASISRLAPISSSNIQASRAASRSLTTSGSICQPTW